MDMGFLLQTEVIELQLSINILILGSLQILLLMMSVHVIAFLWIRDNVLIHIVDALMLLFQLSGLVCLRQHALGYSGNMIYLIIAVCIFLLLPLLRLLWLLREVQNQRKKLRIPRSVRETIDTLPGGISISTPEGHPILVNQKMNELVYLLTGHTIMNARITWQQLQQIDSSQGCKRLFNMRANENALHNAQGEGILFSFPNGSIWQFQRVALTETLPHFIQMEATDITQLYRYSERLYENNRRLSEQYQRQQNLLANIVEINQEKELLSMKMRIHDELGQSILTTKQQLNNKKFSAHMPYLAEMWSRTICKLSDSKQNDVQPEVSPEMELQRVANMIGCRIDFTGDRPAQRKTALLFYALVREALINAVRHAKADVLSVQINPIPEGYQVIITDNGTIPIFHLTEGNGLSNLRRRLEQEGATLEIKCEGSVALIVQLPVIKQEVS